jgi:hypothetical protein
VTVDVSLHPVNTVVSARRPVPARAVMSFLMLLVRPVGNAAINDLSRDPKPIAVGSEFVARTMPGQFKSSSLFWI